MGEPFNKGVSEVYRRVEKGDSSGSVETFFFKVNRSGKQKRLFIQKFIMKLPKDGVGGNQPV